jgi:hypothetical protein
LVLEPLEQQKQPLQYQAQILYLDLLHQLAAAEAESITIQEQAQAVDLAAVHLKETASREQAQPVKDTKVVVIGMRLELAEVELEQQCQMVVAWIHTQVDQLLLLEVLEFLLLLLDHQCLEPVAVAVAEEVLTVFLLALEEMAEEEMAARLPVEMETQEQ